jgi:hypothetical protein
MTVKDVCLAACKSVEVSFRISVYRFNYKEIQDKGEFKESFAELLGQVQKLLVSLSLNPKLTIDATDYHGNLTLSA